MARVARHLLTGVLAVLLAGCIGATSREDFDEEVRSRGGGLTNEFLIGPLDTVAAELGAGSWSDLEILSLRADPGNRSVTVVVRQPLRPEFVDTISVRDGEIVGSVPLQDADDLPLDDLAIALDSVAVDRIEEIATAALDEFGELGAFVDGVAVTRAGTGVTIAVDVESARRTATVTFDADGTLEGVR